jgi:hypothetical protein
MRELILMKNPILTTKAQRHNSDSCPSVFVVKKQNEMQ